MRAKINARITDRCRDNGESQPQRRKNNAHITAMTVLFAVCPDGKEGPDLSRSVAVPITDPDVSLRKLARKEFRKLVRTMDALGPLPTDEAVHAARIKVKRLRYTAELAAPFGGPKLELVVAETRILQDLLGDHQDAHVAEERIRTLLATALPADTHLAAGRLIERERIRRRTIRRELPAAWEALAEAGRHAFR